MLNINDAVKALLREVDHNLKPVAVEDGSATYEVAIPNIPAHETVSGPLRHFLRTAARGIELRLRTLLDRDRGAAVHRPTG